MEIEKKYLLAELPGNLPIIRKAYIEQSYIASGDSEVRIRRRVDEEETFKMCFKSSGDLVREEYEISLSADQYANLLLFCKGSPITKEYYVYDLNGMELECSIVDKNTNNEFVYGEIEFEDEKTALSFGVPTFALSDVTTDKSYKMKNYWNRTRGC